MNLGRWAFVCEIDGVGPSRETRVRRQLSIALAASIGLLAGALPRAAGPAGDSLERPFAAGGAITMDLSAGKYVITGTPDPHMRVRWSTKKASDAKGVSVKVDVSGRSAQLVTNSSSDGLRVEIELPSHTDLVISLSAGDFTLSGVEGSKDISAWAGDLKIDVGDPDDYKTVYASVTAGDLDADAFDRTTHGLFRSFEHTGSGKYALRVRLTAGHIILRSERGSH
jgi:hypothetical protein